MSQFLREKYLICFLVPVRPDRAPDLNAMNMPQLASFLLSQIDTCINSLAAHVNTRFRQNEVSRNVELSAVHSRIAEVEAKSASVVILISGAVR